MPCNEFLQEFLIKVRDSIDWTHAMKKEARRIEDKDLGEVQQAAQNYILLERQAKQRGILDPNRYCRKL